MRNLRWFHYTIDDAQAVSDAGLWKDTERVPKEQRSETHLMLDSLIHDTNSWLFRVGSEIRKNGREQTEARNFRMFERWTPQDVMMWVDYHNTAIAKRSGNGPLDERTAAANDVLIKMAEWLLEGEDES